MGDGNSVLVALSAVSRVQRYLDGVVSLAADGEMWRIPAGPQAEAVWKWFCDRPDVLAFEPDPVPVEEGAEG